MTLNFEKQKVLWVGAKNLVESAFMLFLGVLMHRGGIRRQFGAVVPPDGRQVRYMTLGGVLNYDMPEYGAVFRVKALTTVIARNVVESQTVVVGFAKKLH